MTFNSRYSGSFAGTAGTLHDVLLPQGVPDKFVLRNRDAWGDDADEVSVESYRFRGMAEEAFQSMDQAVTTGILSTEAGTTNGFRFIDSFNPPTFASLATTDITVADPAVATMASTGSIQVGSVVRLDNTTAMLQISGYDFEVTAVTTDTNITLNLDSVLQPFAAAATAGNVRLIVPGRFYPRRRFIVPLSNAAGITVATSAVVSTSVAHDFTVGEKVRLKVPSAYGMTEANNLVGSVTAVGTYTVTTDIDSSGFTAFAFPTSALYAAGLTPAEIIPAGTGPEAGANPPGVPVNAASDNRNRFVMRCGSSVIISTATYDWEAYYSTSYVAE